ncbi:phosphate acyltransferase PlsX [Tepidibacillus fermentans]|uniref:Phosphate acyltransferase n=1 Tax=Tepidibacillus fermentans TaxID=1281767 RepID=A0A4R3K899_9BACI|nr:phosphate acyltransferase PlsX [Tepidibacillus fermentans]TCS79226.1 phosphate:acyl-[acyl carrier protein] acyltransferase [Tepidibacillus fermentans]
MKIALDAMGGDLAPKSTVEGAIEAAKKFPDIHLVLVGNSEEIKNHMKDPIPSNITIHHASDVIKTEDEPVKAVRRKKDSSLVVASQMVKNKEVDAVITAGNTGAFMAAGLLVAGRIPGIERPALAPVIPTTGVNGILVLDVGANMDPKAEHLVQYALMGKIYAEQVLGIDNPRIGLLNVGTEETKGNELMKSTFPLLKEMPINFVGNVEAREVPNGVCDVLVTDGFSGNVLLKLTEGLASSIFAVLKKEFTKSTFTKLASLLLKPSLKNLKKQMDYSEIGGAPLLGVNGAFIKAHGSSDAKAIMNAVRQARLFLVNGVLEKIANAIEQEK